MGEPLALARYDNGDADREGEGDDEADLDGLGEADFDGDGEADFDGLVECDGLVFSVGEGDGTTGGGRTDRGWLTVGDGLAEADVWALLVTGRMAMVVAAAGLLTGVLAVG